MKLVQALIAGIFVSGMVLGCGSVPEEERWSSVTQAASTVPSALDFRHSTVPSIETLNSVAFGNGKFVAGGKHGTIEFSADALQWTRVSVPFAGDVQSVVFSSRIRAFYALVTDPSLASQQVFSSADGKKWTALSSLALFGHATLSVANDKFFASGHDSATGVGTVYASSDARTWTRSPTSLSDGLFDEVVFGAGRYAAHASDEDGNSAVWLSSDGSSWTLTHGLGQGGKAIVFGAGKFLAARDRRIESSPDGINWTISLDTEGSSFSTLVFNGGFRAFDQGGEIWTSSDAVTWTRTAAAADVSVFDVAVSGGTYVGVGAGGSLAITSTLTSWTVVNPPGGVSYLTIAFGSGKFVMADRGRVQTSTDAVNWKTVIPVTSGRSYQRIKHVHNAFYSFYVCSSDNDTCIADSNDGINWLHSYSFSEEKPRDITYGNGKCVIVQRQGFISNFTSFGGLSTWQVDVFELSPPDSFIGVAFGAGKFVAVVEGGTICTSTNGSNWDVHTGTGLSDVTSLTFGNGTFVAATASGVFASANGTSFTRVFTPPAGALNNQVGFANALFFYTGDNGFLASSADGRTWSVVPSNTTDTVYQVAFGNALYVAGGDHNTVLTSK